MLKTYRRSGLTQEKPHGGTKSFTKRFVKHGAKRFAKEAAGTLLLP
jgi:hypothetical protein